jgi:hypothetical protein
MNRGACCGRTSPAGFRKASLLKPPIYGEKLEILVLYMALRTRQLDWMIELPRGGSDEAVRYVRLWADQGQEPKGDET